MINYKHGFAKRLLVVGDEWFLETSMVVGRVGNHYKEMQ